jgi:hypothetical protein
MDCEKAFDEVPRGKLWDLMNKGFSDHIMEAVESLFMNARKKVTREHRSVTKKYR